MTGKTDKRKLEIAPTGSDDPVVSVWLGAYEDCRQRTLQELTGYEEAWINREAEGGSTAGSILYHVAAIAASWLYGDVLENEWPEDFGKWFPYPVREDGTHLTRIPGEPLARHVERLAHMQTEVAAAIGGMPLQEFRRARTFDDYSVTPEWVLQHLMQHEAEHRSQLIAIREQFEK